jgi:hypothetical protein
MFSVALRILRPVEKVEFWHTIPDLTLGAGPSGSVGHRFLLLPILNRFKIYYRFNICNRSRYLRGAPKSVSMNRFYVFLESGFPPDFRISRFPNYRMSGFPDFRICGFPDFLISGFLVVRNFEFPPKTIYFSGKLPIPAGNHRFPPEISGFRRK